jgi:hypothetical protein
MARRLQKSSQKNGTVGRLKEQDHVPRKNSASKQAARGIDHAILPSTSAKFAIAVKCSCSYSRNGKDCNEGIELHRWLIDCDIAGKEYQD